MPPNPTSAANRSEALALPDPKRRRIASGASRVSMTPERDLDSDESTSEAGDEHDADAAQVSWQQLWEVYRQCVNKKGPCATNQPNGVYDLVVQATFAHGATSQPYSGAGPDAAMQKAKQLFSLLSNEDKEAAHKKGWRWSPQSLSFRKDLAEWYGDDPLEKEDGVLQGTSVLPFSL